MASDNFQNCLKITLAYEGGWADNPKDPGGATMRGITLATFRRWYPKATKADLRAISADNISTIYRTDYWNLLNGDTLAAGVDLASFDAGVMSGPGRAKKWLLASVGGSDTQTIKNICAKRLGFVQSLKSLFKTFGKGWTARIASVEAKAVAMASKVGANAAVVKKTLQHEAEAAKNKSITQSTAGTGAASGGVVTTQVPVDQASHTAGLILIGVILGAIALALAYRAYVNHQRAKAYTNEAAAI